MKIEPITLQDHPVATFKTIEDLLGLLYKPYEIELAYPKLTIHIDNEEKLPVWLCAKLPSGIYTAVAVTVSIYDEN